MKNYIITFRVAFFTNFYITINDFIMLLNASLSTHYLKANIYQQELKETGLFRAGNLMNMVNFCFKKPSSLYGQLCLFGFGFEDSLAVFGDTPGSVLEVMWSGD